jgi:hypothetical protein
MRVKGVIGERERGTAQGLQSAQQPWRTETKNQQDSDMVWDDRVYVGSVFMCGGVWWRVVACGGVDTPVL